MKRPRQVSAAVVAFLTVTGLSACSLGSAGSSDTKKTSQTIVIGFPGDFSSDWAYYDLPMKEGAQFAVDQINANGGVLGKQLRLVTVDTRGDTTETAKATEQLLGPGAIYLIGTTAEGINAEGTVACGAGVSVSTGDGTAATLVGDIGKCAYQLVMNDTIQGGTIAEYAAKQGYKSAYVLSSAVIPYTKNLPKYFTQVFEKNGGQVVGTDQFKLAAGDYSAAVTKLANASPKPDVIFTPMFPPDTQVFLRQLRQAGVNTPVLSTDGNLDNSLRDAGAHALDGFIFTAAVCPPGTDNDRVTKFFADYKSKNSKEPSSVVAVLGVDEVNIVAQALKDAGSASADSLTKALANVKYNGISGPIEMDPATRRVRKPAALVKMDGQKFTCLAQPSFPGTVPEP
jgi:branched-chain amino acid transport system substrate-binding protein